MFTNNYTKYRKMKFWNEQTSFVDCIGNSVTGCTGEYNHCGEIGVAIKNAYCREMVNHQINSYTQASCLPGVYFGSGSTPATVDDYKLEHLITTGLTITNPEEIVEQNENDDYYFTSYFILENTTDATINIYEIGLFGEVLKYDKTLYHHAILFRRDVLGEPISIAPGEVKRIAYKLVYHQVLNVE